MDEDLRKDLHSSSIQSPAAWLVQANELREAAKALDWLPVDRETMTIKGSLVVYRLLMSLSLENLIKGIIVAQRIRNGERDFLKGIYSHKLEMLAKIASEYGLGFNSDEITLLTQATTYIEWAGRYPFPKFFEDYGGRAHDSNTHQLEVVLWERLFIHLKEIGWASKGVERFEGWYYLLTKG